VDFIINKRKWKTTNKKEKKMDNSATWLIESKIEQLESDKVKNNIYINSMQNGVNSRALDNQDIDAEIENLRAALTILSI
jgi:hypothetical protein